MKLQWKNKLQRTVMAGVFAALLVVLSQVSIPLPTGIPVTLQTFAGALCGCVLGPAVGSAAVGVYLALGAVGVPVFAGFGAGPGTLFGPTGGYILGFVFTALAMWGAEAKLGEKLPARIAGMAVGLVLCYAFGTAWFMVVYARANGAIGLGAALSMCVIPFILPDCVKIALAMLVAARLRPHLKL